MTKDANVLFAQFERFLKSTERTRARVEVLVAKGYLNRGDAEIVYSSLFLAIFARFETLLEELFFGILSGRINGSSCGALPRIQLKSDLVARAIVHQDKEYLDWLPYKRTEDRAKAFLRGGRPFTALDDGERSRLRTMLTLRHSIAHTGRHSQMQFKDKVLGSVPLPPRERNPPGFLRSQYRISPSQTRFELFADQIKSIVKRLTHV